MTSNIIRGLWRLAVALSILWMVGGSYWFAEKMWSKAVAAFQQRSDFCFKNPPQLPGEREYCGRLPSYFLPDDAQGGVINLYGSAALVAGMYLAMAWLVLVPVAALVGWVVRGFTSPPQPPRPT